MVLFSTDDIESWEQTLTNITKQHTQDEIDTNKHTPRRRIEKTTTAIRTNNVEYILERSITPTSAVRCSDDDYGRRTTSRNDVHSSSGNQLFIDQ